MNLAKTGVIALRFLRRNAPLLISAAAGIGLAALYILTIKETEEATEVINQAEEEEADGLETAKKVAKIYAPSFICLIVTMFCIVSSAVISHHRIRDLTTYAASMTAMYNQYRQHNIIQNGKESDQKVIGKIAREHAAEDPTSNEGGIMCLMPGYDHIFTVPSLVNVYEAITKLNLKMEKGPGNCELDEFMELAKAKEEMDPRYIAYGWETFDLDKNYGVSCLYPNIFKDTDDSGLEYYVIDLPMPRRLDMII